MSKELVKILEETGWLTRQLARLFLFLDGITTALEATAKLQRLIAYRTANKAMRRHRNL